MDSFDFDVPNVMSFADAIKDEDAIIEGYNNSVEKYVRVRFRNDRSMSYYVTPLAGDFAIFNKIVKVANGSFTVDAVSDDKKQMVAGNALIYTRGKNRKFSFRSKKNQVKLSDDELDMIEERLMDIGDGDNIQDIGEAVIEDLVKTGNCFVQIRKTVVDGNEKLFFSVIPIQNCRLKLLSWLDERGKEHKIDASVAVAVGVCQEWGKAMGLVSRSDIFDIPLYGRSENDWADVVVGDVEYQVTAIHIKFRKTGFKHYGMPKWVSAYWYAVFEHVFGRLNVTKVKNNSMASGVLQLFANPNITKERSTQIKNEIQERYNTIDGAGSIMVQVLTDKSLAAEFISFEGKSGKEGDYIKLLEVCSKALITTMRTFPDLAGIATAGELGGTDKVKSNFIIAQNRDVFPHQNFIIEKLYLPIFSMINQYEKDENFKDLNCEYSNSVPALLFGDVQLGTVLSRNELRSELGFPEIIETNNEPIGGGNDNEPN